MECADAEFLAEKTLVSIIPTFSAEKLYLITGDVGPFAAGTPLSVPLWMALNLKQRQQCRILPPAWLCKEFLEDKKQDEMDSTVFTEMPCEHYLEVTQMLFDVAAADIPDASEVRTLVKDIWDIRQAKLRSSVDAFVKSDEVHARVDHLTLMEIVTVRRLFCGALNHLNKLRQVKFKLLHGRFRRPPSQ
ncbi:DNA replication complex GINS protein PSF2 isoform X2 [Dermacentor silvarum]|uniref:DNA replication complex GINS protein PSF2 isoform X2 n=1 Tax=Dermacentor silvarum TaxID=543639 RepID=UPI0021016705|nr:DNA replication complex GINS protein PSF2 isoform X2 [Dermacentor silvarum]